MYFLSGWHRFIIKYVSENSDACSSAFYAIKCLNRY